MTRSSRRSHAAFTLVEMLVVIGIIAILAALLLPAINKSISGARNAAIAIEVNQLASAIEAYKQDKGDYPPNFRDAAVVTRHIRKCYPKIDPNYFAVFMALVFPSGSSNAPVIDESEALVFWLSMTDTNPQFPFLSFPLADPATAVAATKTQKAIPPALYSASLPPSPKRYYDFDQTRLSKSLSNDVPSYAARYCKDSFYIYIDSRSYDHPATDLTDVCHFSATDGATIGNTYAFADDNAKGVRPYWSDPVAANALATTITSPVLYRDKFKPINPTSFQLICAGQDGEFGGATVDLDVKCFPSGLNYSLTGEDKDNITNFSNGKTLGDNIP